MSIRSAQAITIEFITSNPTTQAALNADSLPTGTLVVNGTDNGATVTVTNVDTGRYKAAVTLPTLAIGDVAEIVIAATVSTIAGKAVVWRDSKDVLLDGSGNVTFANTTLATVTNLTNAPTAGDFTLTMKTSITTAATSATPTITLPTIPTDWIAAAGVKADAVTKIQSGLATPTNITAGTITTVTTLTNLPAITTDWLTGTGVAASAVTKIQAGLAKVGSAPFPASGSLVDAILNEVNTAATHNVNNSVAKQIRIAGGAGGGATGVIYTATCPSQAGMTSTQIKLDSGASAVDNIYQWDVISIVSGTDAGDSAIITGYVGSTRVATVNFAWAVQPSNTSVFEITPTAVAQVVGNVTVGTNLDKTGYSLAASQHVIVDSGTVTTLTNLPAITTDWLTGTGVATSAVNKIQAGLSTYAGGAVASVTATVNATLVSTGLDAIATTAPTGPATTFPGMMVQMWRRLFKGSAKALSGHTLKTFADDGTTVITTQTWADDGAGTETLGGAS